MKCATVRRTTPRRQKSSSKGEDFFVYLGWTPALFYNADAWHHDTSLEVDATLLHGGPRREKKQTHDASDNLSLGGDFVPLDRCLLMKNLFE